MVNRGARTRLRGVLTREQERKGYRLVEVDDHFVELWFKDEAVAVFSSSGPTAVRLREEADKHWANRQWRWLGDESAVGRS